MGFNEAKCNVLYLGSTSPCYEYSMRNTSLETITEKDFSVTIDRDLKFHMHVSKASRLLGFVRETFTCINEMTLPRLFTTMVWPHLEYGKVIWCPPEVLTWQAGSWNIQRAIKLIPNFRSLSYRDRLEFLRHPSLCYRRRWGDMLQVYKILKGTDWLESNQFFSLADISNTRGHSFKLVKHRSRSKCIQSVSDKWLEWFTSRHSRQSYIKYIQDQIRQTLD